MDASAFSYWNTTDPVRSAIRDLIRSGHVDCIHSFGDTATTRAQAAETLEHLQAHGCGLRVWIDHAVASTNFGPDIMQGHGDEAGHPAYHADLSLRYGLRYVWRGRVTSMRGQDAPTSVAGIWRSTEPRGSLVTLAKETAKVCAAAFGNTKYAMHRDNRLLTDVVLRDSQAAIEFLRSNPHPLGVSAGDNACGLADALSDAFLDRLAERRGKSIVYTHLGKRIDPASGFSARTRSALEKLADRMQKGQILVTTTERLLDYTRLRERLRWNVRDEGGVREIVLEVPDGIPSCAGLSFMVPAGQEWRIIHSGSELETARAELPGMPRSVVHVPWRRLSYGQ
jgi:hypothetical protein